MDKSKEFLSLIVSSIAQYPFTIDAVTDEMGVLLTLSPSKEDIGRIIGKEGSTANSIRTLLRVVGMSENARVNLKINEPSGGKYVIKE